MTLKFAQLTNGPAIESGIELRVLDQDRISITLWRGSSQTSVTCSLDATRLLESELSRAIAKMVAIMVLPRGES